MGKILSSYILLHPPILVPEVGRGREEEAAGTIAALKKAVKEIAEENPTTIILSSPHAPCFRDYVYVPDKEELSGNFGGFGHSEIRLSVQNNLELQERICKNAELAGIQCGSLRSRERELYGITDILDHGSMVPIYFIRKELQGFRIVLLSTPLLSLREIYRFGQAVAEAVDASDETVVYVASGDLSHRLTKEAPAGYHPKGAEYDSDLIQLLKKNDVQGMLNIDERYLEAAGECGTRSIIMMLGALDGLQKKAEIYHYEGPFGVGYLVAKEVLQNQGKEENDAEDFRESHYVRLARQSLETYIKDNRKLKIPDWVRGELKERRAGVFVSLKKHGNLRGCIGTIGSTRESLAEEIIQNAIHAGTEDPRFLPISEEELQEISYSVDVLGEPERISSIEELDVQRYGVIVSSGFRRGLLLPDLEGVDTPELQIEIALQKAGIRQSEKFQIERFEVIRYR